MECEREEEMREILIMKQPLERSTDRPLAMLLSNVLASVPQRHAQSCNIVLSHKELLYSYTDSLLHTHKHG